MKAKSLLPRLPLRSESEGLTPNHEQDVCLAKSLELKYVFITFFFLNTPVHSFQKILFSQILISVLTSVTKPIQHVIIVSKAIGNVSTRFRVLRRQLTRPIFSLPTPSLTNWLLLRENRRYHPITIRHQHQHQKNHQ